MKWYLDLVERSILWKRTSFGSNGCDRLQRWDFTLPVVARSCWKWVDVLAYLWHYEEKNCSKTSSSSCKFSKPVASFPGLPKFSRVWFRDYMVVRALASSPGSAQLLLRKSRRGHGVYRIERMVEKILIVHGSTGPRTAKRAKGY